MALYNNESYPEIEKFVEEDLEKYGQHNPCPMSLTVVNGNLWRHYELGAILGFVIFNKYEEYDKRYHFFISTLSEDDENWFAPRTPMYMAAGWTNAVNKTWQRMLAWQKEHLFEGWKKDEDITDSGSYHFDVIKEIVPEEVPWPDEIPDNDVLGTKFLNSDDE